LCVLNKLAARPHVGFTIAAGNPIYKRAVQHGLITESSNPLSIPDASKQSAQVLNTPTAPVLTATRSDSSRSRSRFDRIGFALSLSIYGTLAVNGLVSLRQAWAPFPRDDNILEEHKMEESKHTNDWQYAKFIR
jgi:hypothetical protein